MPDLAARLEADPAGQTCKKAAADDWTANVGSDERATQHRRPGAPRFGDGMTRWDVLLLCVVLGLPAFMASGKGRAVFQDGCGFTGRGAR